MGRRGIGPRSAQPSSGLSSSGASNGTGSRAAPKKPGHGATYSVVVMTLAALAGVGVLAAQAAATAPNVSTTATGKSTPTKHPVNTGSSGATTPKPDPNALPANSGSGLRVVYGEAAKKVWLVSANNSVARTFVVVPGTVAAPTGNFTVTNRLSSSQGSDGTPVQYVVIFNNARVDHVSTSFGFDAVANVTGLPPAATSRTGGIRMAQTDAQALWSFTNFGTAVVVVP